MVNTVTFVGFRVGDRPCSLCKSLSKEKVRHKK